MQTQPMIAAIPEAEPAPAQQWHVVWTRSHCEQLVFDQLTGKGLRPFLPKMTRWRSRAGVPRRHEIPMFPGYLFLHGVIDKHAYVQVLGARGTVQLLGARWDQLAEVPAREMAAIQRLAGADLPLHSHPFLREGERVRIHEGPLAGIEGLLVRHRPGMHLVVVSIELLRRSLAVEVNRDHVAAA